MQIQTFSVVVGTSACQASCKFCVSHTTGFDNLPDSKNINKNNLRKAIQLAKIGGCTTLLFTGKGEPTLYPKEITQYLDELIEFQDSTGFSFPFIELQTNALAIGEAAKLIPDEILNDDYSYATNPAHQFRGKVFESKVLINKNLQGIFEYFSKWQELGLNTIAISTVGINQKHNKEVYLHHRDVEYPDLSKTVKLLHQLGFSTRLCVMMQNNMVDDIDDLIEVCSWCKKNDVAQLTARPIRRPLMPVANSDSYIDYIENHGLSQDQIDNIKRSIRLDHTHLLTIMQGKHEAKVYDVNGQNLCLSDCLTIEPESDNIRTLIFFSDGKLFYDWSFPGARLL